MQLKHNLFQILVSLDQFLNCVICTIIEPNSKTWADCTFSAVCHIHYMKGRWVWVRNLVNAIFFWQEDHCKEAYESELSRAHLPVEMRTNTTDFSARGRMMGLDKHAE